MIISFAGPFSWADAPGSPSVYGVPEARESGIYLWTVPVQSGHLIYYVGETGVSFSYRLGQHSLDYLAAKSCIYSAAEFARGEKVMLWPGYWGAARKPKEECLANGARLNTPIHGDAERNAAFSCTVQDRRPGSETN